MYLKDLLAYDSIVIQCHNNPDADAIASGYALWTWFKDHGKKARFVYSGHEPVSKPNIRLMIDLLAIPVEFVRSIDDPDLLVMADCQYGERNTEVFPAKTVAVIDHHQTSGSNPLPELHEVMSTYGSCATVVFKLFEQDGYDFSGNLLLQTALYYGLYMDTVQFQELWHPADKDLWDCLRPDEGIISTLKNSNITSGDLLSIGSAFLHHKIDHKYRYAITEVNTDDRNILGLVADTLLEVDCVDSCVVYGHMEGQIRLSVRSCVKEIRADELVRFIVDSVGAGGGHMKKAAGGVYKPIEEEWADYLNNRLHMYFDETDTVYAGKEIDLSGFREYQKLPVRVAVADLSPILPAGTRLLVRTLEGDMDVTVSDDQLLMIGVKDEAYPIKKEKYEKNYQTDGQPYHFSGDYIPVIRNHNTGEMISLEGIARECQSKGSSVVYARQLTKRTHVFTLWDSQKYAYGEPGDWIAVQKDNTDDVYIITKDVFEKTYVCIG